MPDLPLRLPFDAAVWRAADAVVPSPLLRAALAPWRAVLWLLERELFPLPDRELFALFDRDLLAVLAPLDDLEAPAVLLFEVFALWARARVDCGLRFGWLAGLDDERLAVFPRLV